MKGMMASDPPRRIGVGVSRSVRRAPSCAPPPIKDLAEAERDYRDGFSTKVGLGVVPPRDSSGPFLVYEAEYLTLYSRTFSQWLKNAVPSRLPDYRVNNAIMGGLSAAF